MRSGIVLRGGLTLRDIECRVCDKLMVVSRQPNAQCVLFVCRGVDNGVPCGTRVLIATCAEAEARVVTFWSMSCPRHNNLARYARELLGAHAEQYGFRWNHTLKTIEKRPGDLIRLDAARRRLRA